MAAAYVLENSPPAVSDCAGGRSVIVANSPGTATAGSVDIAGEPLDEHLGASVTSAQGMWSARRHATRYFGLSREPGTDQWCVRACEASPMVEKSGVAHGDCVREGKYARIERERRFLPAEPPSASSAVAVRLITDRYLVGTRLRLRRTEQPDTGACEFKLTQKVPAERKGAVQGLITNTYLSPDEYRLPASLPAAVLVKNRLSVPPFSIDVFGPPLRGLVLAEAEFTSDEEAEAFVPPQEYVAEVTDDARFTGGRLVRASRSEVLAWLAEYGIRPGSSTA
ncbi:hypothetical protein [Streptomyces sp. NPDC048473]|uniref:hypothetical protein n=1 Tax=unclassified Streptomyces TaxID=2593676 RepID=UPI003718A50E